MDTATLARSAPIVITSPIRASRHVVRGWKGVAVGEVRHGVLTRHVTLTRHLFRQTDGWTLGAVGADRARRAGVHTLRYVVADHGIYSIGFEDFVDAAERKKFPNNDETQLVVSRSRWRFVDAHPTSHQTSLFAEVSASR